MEEATLMSLTSDYMALLDMAQDPDVDEQTLLDTMEGITGEISVKAGGYVAVIDHLASKAAMYKMEAKRLNSAAKVMENNIDRMKDRIKYAMETMGTKAIETKYNRIIIKGNGGAQPLVITGEVPQSYKKIVLEDDKEKIRGDLASGKELDFAHLEERGTHLEIK